MEFNVDGIVTLSRLTLLANARSPRDARPSPMVRDLSDEQSMNACSPMASTPTGISMDSMLSHRSNRYLPMVPTDSPNFRFFNVDFP